jgi:excisionase family DNA binding protein
MSEDSTQTMAATASTSRSAGRGFLDALRRSELLEDSQIAALIDGYRQRLGDPLSMPEQFAEFLVRQSAITPWQAGMLLKGRSQGFFLGAYKLLDHLGSGGMSCVFRAVHQLMRREVAIKVLIRSKDPNSPKLKRFFKESQAVAELNHPNIVRAYHFDQHEGRHYLVMEYVVGHDLQRLVDQNGPMPVAKAASYVAQAAEGLAHAHQAGLIHRDIKPANLLVDNDDVLKLLDLGLVRRATVDDTSLTNDSSGRVLGSVNYMAPEQIRCFHSVDHRCDLYSLGCVLYFLLTGRPPFPEGGLAEKLDGHLRREPAPVETLRPDTPSVLRNLCRRMMAKRPEDRVQQAVEVAAQLNRWLATTWNGTRPDREPAPSRYRESVAAEQGRQDVMTLEEVAAYLRLPPGPLLDLAERGKLPGQNVVGQWRFHKDAVDRWLQVTDFTTTTWRTLRSTLGPVEIQDSALAERFPPPVGPSAGPPRPSSVVMRAAEETPTPSDWSRDRIVRVAVAFALVIGVVVVLMFGLGS